MKRVAFVSILLLAPVVVFAAGAAAPDSAPMVEATSTAAPFVEAPALFKSPEQMIFPGPVPCDPYPQYIDCERLNDSYCTYEWNGCRGCCEPVYIAPGAYCPQICQ